jgi:peptidoglycan/LPS O-acetylase OafA/YrhL
MTFFAAILLLVVTRNVRDPRKKLKAALAMISLALLLFAVPLFGEVLGSPVFERYGALARVAAAVFLPYGLYHLAPGENARSSAGDPDV